jgi:quercetin dioxygenase-like cupin family protein
MALGLTVATTTPLISLTTPALARTYAPDEGEETAPGVRVVELGTQDSMISAYKTLMLRDVVFQPGAAIPEKPMDHDMVCHITAGEFKITQGDIKFMLKEGDMYTCGKGKP